MEEKESREKMKKQNSVQSLCNIITINEDNNNLKNKIKRRENVDKNYVIKHLSEMRYKMRPTGGDKFEEKNNKGEDEK